MVLSVESDLESRVLEILISSQSYVSGESIASRLGVSRATINRVIKSLIQKGFAIESHPRLGYRLVNLDDVSKLSIFVSSLNTRIRFSIHYLSVCDSTQDVAESLASSGAPEGTVVIAEELRRGRGRLGRKWYAPRGGIWMSIVFRPRYIEQMHLISIAMGVAVAKTLRSLFNIDAKVKWPNDVVIDDKKVCGILVEGKAEADKIHYIIVGIGINVNNDLPEELRGYATTVKEVLGKEAPRTPIILSLLRNIDDIYYKLSTEREYVLSEWRKLSATLGRRVKVVTLTEEIVGIAKDIDRDGSLIIVRDSGEETKVFAGDVIHLR